MYFASVVILFLSVISAYNLDLFNQPPDSVTLADFKTVPELKLMTTSALPKLRVLTQNIFMRPPLIKNNESDWKDDRLDYLIEHILPNYDVVCLQEMFEFASSRRSRLLAAANKLGFIFYVSSTRQFLWNLAIDGGLVILSRFPIVKSEELVYTRGMGPDWIPKKGVLYAKIAIHSQTGDGKPSSEALTHAHVFTTHTQASYGEVIITQPDVKHRLLQLHEFHSMLERVLPKERAAGEPVILTGDFNVDSRNHVLTDPGNVKYERDVEDGVATSDEGGAMMAILRGYGIDPKLLGPENTDDFKGKDIIELHDTLYERLGYHPVTFGNTYVDKDGVVHPRETVLTTRQDNEVMHSIDYIMWHNPDAEKHRNGVVAKVVDVGVTPNFTPGMPFTQISDHYGVSGVFEFSLP